jgi:hypothetical protein
MQNDPFRARSAPTTQPGDTAQNGYARASYASGGGAASRMPRIAGDVTAGPALVSRVLVRHSPCAERRRL